MELSFVSSYLLLLCTVGYLLWLLFQKKGRVKQLYEKFPGPYQFPIIGSAYVLAVDPTDMVGTMFKLCQKYGSRYALRLMDNYSLVLSDPADVEKVLSSNVNINRNSNYDVARSWIGDGLLLSKGTKWRNHRKFITPTFHFKILNKFLQTFNDNSKTLVDVLSKASDNTVVDLFPFVNRCALEAICGTAMGVKMGLQNDATSEYGKAVHRYTELVTFRSFRPWLARPWIWRLTSEGRESLKCEQILLKFTDDVINERKKEWKAKPRVTPQDDLDHEDYGGAKRRTEALLDLLLQEQEKDENSLNNEDLLDEVNTFIFTGHDTITAGVTWTLILLGSNPEHQALVHEELDHIFGDDKSRDVTPADLTEMKYLEMCIKESMRIYPPVPAMMRLVDADMQLDDGTIIPAGSEVSIFQYVMHHNADLFPEPSKFDPERFTLENVTRRHPFSYIPFSAGPRNCIGQRFAMMESKVMLSTIFRNFIVQTLTPLPHIKPLYASILKPGGQTDFKLTRR